MTEHVKNITVLLIDDDDALLTQYNTAFELHDIKTETAKDGLDGLAKAKKVHPAAIVVDLMMPKVDGKTFLYQLKEDPTTKDIPVIVCTALIEDIEKNEVLKAGANDYIVKTDTDPNDLVKRVKKLIGSGQ